MVWWSYLIEIIYPQLYDLKELFQFDDYFVLHNYMMYSILIYLVTNNYIQWTIIASNKYS